MGLSSNTIVHFTKRISSLKGILSSNFHIRYCQETIESKTNQINLLIPMVSFSDIPFSQILNHVNNYGCYGIGLSKTWAENNGLNPVLYLERNSSLSNHVTQDLLSTLKDGSPKKIRKFDLSTQRARDILRYLKNYQGNLFRGGKLFKTEYRFSDEREWRYVLNPSDQFLFYSTLIESQKYDIPDIKEKLNKEIELEKLRFTPNDINYIIIKKESERDAIITTIEKAKGKYSHTEVKRLTSRIISVEQLKTDF